MKIRLSKKNLFFVPLILFFSLSIPFTYFLELPHKEILLTLEVFGLVITLFVSELVRVDVVGLLLMVLLPLIGLVAPEKAISGLSSNAVVSIIAVMIIGAGLDKTGVMNKLAGFIVKIAGKSETRIMTLISGTVAVISSFMQNIGAAALFLPAVLRIARNLNIPVSRLLMPMGFMAILGGTLTLVGSSPLILLNDLLQIYNLEPFGLFSVTPLGALLVAGGLLYFIFIGRYLLPKVKTKKDEGKLIPPELEKTYDKICNLYELKAPDNFKTKTIEEMDTRKKYGVTIVAVHHVKRKTKNFAPHIEEVVEPGDDIAVVGCPEQVRKMVDDLGFILKPELDEFAEDLSPTNAGVVEGIIPPRSELIGKTLREVRFRKRYEVNPLALVHDGKVMYAGISSVKLKAGDAILLFGKWDKFIELKNLNVLTFSTELKGEILRPEKAKWALFWFGVALSLIVFFDVKLSIALLTGAVGMILTKVLHVDEAYNAVDWMTIFLLAGLLPLGIAFQETGTAELIAKKLVASMGDIPELLFYTFVAALTSFFTLVVSNVGATVLLVPLAVDMARDIGADARLAGLTVAVSASNTFVLPTHQVNALIMRPGGYKVIDYVRVGGLMTILFIVLLTFGLYLFYL